MAEVDIVSGQVDPKEEPYCHMLHVGPDNIESGTGRLLECETAQELGLISGKYLFDENHVVYSKIRPYLIKATIPGFVGICGADMYPLKPKIESITKDFLFQYLLSPVFTKQAVAQQGRTGIPKINRQQLGTISIPIPPKGDSEELTTQLCSVDNLIRHVIRVATDTGVLFNTLLCNLVTGQLRIPKSMWIEDEATISRHATGVLFEDAEPIPQSLNQVETAQLLSAIILYEKTVRRISVSRFSYMKKLYLFRRWIHGEVMPAGFNRYKYGPYNHEIRHDGAEVIAIEKGYISPVGDTKFNPGDNKQDCLRATEQLFGKGCVSRFVQVLGEYDDDTMELLATVDFTVQEMKADYSVDPKVIRDDWRKCDVWKGKLRKFTTLDVSNALTELKKLKEQFGGG